MPTTEPPGEEYWIEGSRKDSALQDFYLVGPELGRGATSVVYSCEEKGTKAQYAAKILKKTIDKKIVRTEIGVLLRLSHPNIIKLKEIFETPTEITLILELVTGGELFDRLIDARIWSHVLPSHLQLYLHANGVVHRDLKPENLLYADLSPDAPLKIAPEILHGSPYGPEVDMWSVGVITYILDKSLQFPESPEEENQLLDPPKVQKLIVLDPQKRLTVQQALEHPWVTGKAAKFAHMDSTQKKLQEFNARRKLKGELSGSSMQDMDGVTSAPPATVEKEDGFQSDCQVVVNGSSCNS
ncbi:hypothetical protein JD844_034057 [Phrynosoma platyrhinos]|uniref:Protein kinase domain-containing protein n=1 Tax=Phrynosoma platyrhinos TaxID=52577 RepID=A0ABQ7T7U2_PHRPL|nr:hypothetical protein JD844_034057 [Phrynosoma platyrhinos]